MYMKIERLILMQQNKMHVSRARYINKQIDTHEY